MAAFASGTKLCHIGLPSNLVFSGWPASLQRARAAASMALSVIGIANLPNRPDRWARPDGIILQLRAERSNRERHGVEAIVR